MSTDWETPVKMVTDHEYVGNLCAGFGGRTECQWVYIEGNRICGRSPFEHMKAR